MTRVLSLTLSDLCLTLCMTLLYVAYTCCAVEWFSRVV